MGLGIVCSLAGLIVLFLSMGSSNTSGHVTHPWATPSDVGLGDDESVHAITVASADSPSEATREVLTNVNPEASEPVPPPDPTLSKWEAAAAGLSSSELVAQAEELDGELHSKAATELRARQEAGVHEVVGQGQRYKPSREQQRTDRNELACYRIPGAGSPDNEVRRTHLPRAEFPELYELKGHIEWLRARAAVLASRR